MKQAVICPFFGRLRDRFCEYGEDLSVVEKLEHIARIPGVQGVEIVYPHELRDVDSVKATLEKLGLAVSAVNVNVKSDPEFVKGSITSPDAAVRSKPISPSSGRSSTCWSAPG